ncbi:hypothetical protein MAR_021900 [Mya arenaria]|uniref:Uncharacterized protein n=1 Tax=Mya arenaria TaxID=6604 RepID=A0ABY7ECA8_MYAAR|nr:hypothetical protein MAR_021900 [Mya arenaria]
MYEAIVKAIILSSNQCLPQSKFNRHAKPYWTPEVKKSYSLQREARRVWVLEGQPRGWHNESYAKYKHCKKIFVTTQKTAIENVEKLFNSQLIEAAECDSRLFWSLIKSRKNKRPSACTHLFYKNTSVREPGDILKVFTDYFRDVYSLLQCEHFDNDFKKLVEEKVKQLKIKNSTANSIPEINPTITSETIKTYIKTLKRGKASSYDAIFNEHLIHGGDALHKALATAKQN